MASVLIVDFGSQTTQLIARRVREAGVFCEMISCAKAEKKLQDMRPNAIILSGGPASLSAEESPRPAESIWEQGVPVLGICYGMQSMVEKCGGRVLPHDKREFGHREIDISNENPLFKGMNAKQNVWMSHGDQVSEISDQFEVLAQSETCPVVAVKHREKPWYGVQFHPEVVHTQEGKALLANFLFNVADLPSDWRMDSFCDQQIAAIREQVGSQKVLLGLSGGVDSSVAAALIHKAIGDQLVCVYVDHGLQRAGETEGVKKLFGDAFKMDLRVVHAQDRFLAALSGVTDPEKKRKIIGHTFIEVFDEESFKIRDVDFLAQGTLYPDVIESESFSGAPTAVIKSHHNVGGLPEEMKLKLIEPLRELFKDEVRVLGRELNLPSNVVDRQPFPGPGLAVRILGEITQERLEKVRAADAIVREEIDAGLSSGAIEDELWQWFAALLPVKSVGVVGDARIYADTIAVRAVMSTDGMTADWPWLPKEVLGRISNRIINEVKGVARVVYDISSKPPATIEWE
ncbi:MAG: glutamine-hydrolyzing GMP synthase [Myxococcales bacterium]|nr:glutamine-hydrolyzing GMP synthase [Myxococcales bacterium]